MSNLPSYLAAAKPVPLANRAPWRKTIMPAYIGVMLWFVFWKHVVNGGLEHCPTDGMLGVPGSGFLTGFVPAFLGLIIGAVICHFFFYMPPAMLGVQTGMPLYVVGTSTYGARGGLLMPGFLMGLLQFGWLGVNACIVSEVLCTCFGFPSTAPGWPHGIIAAVFAIVAAFVGLKGIRYVGRVGTYLPLIPVVVLIVLLVTCWGGIGKYQVGKYRTPAAEREFKLRQQQRAELEQPLQLLEDGTMNLEPQPPLPPLPPEAPPLTAWQVMQILIIYVVGFFATAGAAGADIAMNARNNEDVHIGGITGILLPTVLAGEIVLFIIAGAYGSGFVLKDSPHMGILDPVTLIPDILGKNFGNIAMIALAISAFPGACFSSFIAANSFKTTMPRVNPFLSVGLGALVAAALAVSGWAGQVSAVFAVIGASFGPVCGAMFADYLMSRRKWSGPRAGFNPAGWISWIVGFAVGAFNLVVDLLLKSDWHWVAAKFPHLADLKDPITGVCNYVPLPPVTAFVVGFALYVLLSVLGARTKKLPMPGVTA